MTMATLRFPPRLRLGWRCRFALALALALALLGACEVVLPTTSLRVKGAPIDASVTIDDQYIGFFGYVAKHGVAMPRGKHRITVEKTGFFPWDRVVLAGDEPVSLDVVLTPIPD
jgi:hypothetical protein